MFRSNVLRGGLAAMVALAAIAGGLVAFSSQASSAQAFDPPWPDRVYGRPYNFEAGGPNGWYLWRDLETPNFQLCSTTPASVDHPFTAIVRTDGRFGQASKLRLEGADDIVVRDGGKTLVVRFHTWAGVDCLSFDTTGTQVSFRLEEFGQLVPENRIFIGREAVHPASNPFAIKK